jgi:DNA-binding protein WhiA
LRTDIFEIYGHESELAVVQHNGLRKGNRYLVRVVEGGESLARQTGIVDGSGRPVRGLPPAVVSGGVCDSEAAWRGAFLAHGSLTEPGRSSSLEITCPDLKPRWRSSVPLAVWAWPRNPVMYAGSIA